MKKLLTLIIITLSIFSNFNFVNANKQGILENVLDLPYGVEEFEFELPKVGNFYFKNKSNTNKLNSFKNLDKVLREHLIKKYRAGEIEFNKMNGIIDNYTLFIYHTNRYFYYLSEKEKNPRFRELNYAISNNFKLSRSYLKKVKYILSIVNEK